MDAIDRNTILGLAENVQWPSVTILMPVDRLGIHTDADRVRLRNLIRGAREALVSDIVRPPDADALLAGVQRVAEDDSVWAGGPSGLALFVAGEDTKAFWVDHPLPETVLVGNRFYLRPLYAGLTDDTRVWALAIDSNRSRLFHIDRVGVQEVDLPAGTPVSMADETLLDEREESLQFHTVPGATPQGAQGVPSAMFHGHGGAKDADKIQRKHFMLELARGVVWAIGSESAEPLVLLGVDYLVEDFLAVCDYAHIAPKHVMGATDYLLPAQVQREALEAIAPLVETALTADVDEYRALTGTGHTSSDAPEILMAAASGRVRTLLMDDSEGPWGYFNRADFTVDSLCPSKPRMLRDAMPVPETTDLIECGWDLVDLAAAETLLHGGTVRAFTSEASPVKGAAAVFRY